MYAVVETGGKQYRVAVGDVLRVEKLEIPEGGAVNLDKVLMVADGDSGACRYSEPRGFCGHGDSQGTRACRQDPYLQISPSQALSQEPGTSSALHRDRDHRDHVKNYATAFFPAISGRLKRRGQRLDCE